MKNIKKFRELYIPPKKIWSVLLVKKKFSHESGLTQKVFGFMVDGIITGRLW
jgi:hypothetical protein